MPAPHRSFVGIRPELIFKLTPLLKGKRSVCRLYPSIVSVAKELGPPLPVRLFNAGAPATELSSYLETDNRPSAFGIWLCTLQIGLP